MKICGKIFVDCVFFKITFGLKQFPSIWSNVQRLIPRRKCLV